MSCGGQRRGRHLPRAHHERRALHHRAQLARVARPQVALEHLRRLRGEARGGGRPPLALAREEGLRQRQHVLPPVAQRHEPERHHVQPVVEVLPEAASPHRLREIHVRRGHEAHVHLEGADPAHPLEAPLLDHAEELGLQRRDEVLHLVEVQRTPGRHLDLARLGVAGVGEGAPLVAEELRLQQLGRDRGAVDLDEGALAPRAAVVQPVRDEVLAGAALPLEEHGAARLREAQDERHELAHGPRLGHDAGEGLARGGAHPATSTRFAPPQRRSRS